MHAFEVCLHSLQSTPWLEANIVYFDLDEVPELAHPSNCRGEGI